jgi:hypothetical protein
VCRQILEANPLLYDLLLDWDEHLLVDQDRKIRDVFSLCDGLH